METVFAPKAPQAVGPYCHAIKHGELLFTSGQLAINPENGAMVNDDVKIETTQVLKNLEAILKAAGTTRNKVIKVTVYITSLDDFGKINEAYSEFFSPHTPARACVEVSNLALGARVEMDMVAAL